MFDIYSIARGIGAGVCYGLTSFAKKKDQAFDWEKFSVTIVIGGIAGAIMSVMDMPINNSYEFLIGMGAIPVAENVIKVIKRKVIDWIMYKN